MQHLPSYTSLNYCSTLAFPVSHSSCIFHRFGCLTSAWLPPSWYPSNELLSRPYKVICPAFSYASWMVPFPMWNAQEIFGSLSQKRLLSNIRLLSSSPIPLLYLDSSPEISWIIISACTRMALCFPEDTFRYFWKN